MRFLPTLPRAAACLALAMLSTVVAALVLLLLVTGLSGLMAQIPMVALAAVMMIVALSTALPSRSQCSQRPAKAKSRSSGKCM